MRNSWLSRQPRFRLTFFLLLKERNRFMFSSSPEDQTHMYLTTSLTIPKCGHQSEQWNWKIILTTWHLCAMKEQLGSPMVELGIRHTLEGVIGEMVIDPSLGIPPPGSLPWRPMLDLEPPSLCSHSSLCVPRLEARYRFYCNGLSLSSPGGGRRNWGA